jgi:hypothetical protein
MRSTLGHGAKTLRLSAHCFPPPPQAAAIQHLESATTELNKILKAKCTMEMIIATRLVFLCFSSFEVFLPLVGCSQDRYGWARFDSLGC